MRLFYKILAALLFLILAAICGLNFYLRFSGVQEKLRSSAQEASGMALQLGPLSFTPWRGLSVQTITIEDPTNARSVEAFSVSLNIFGLLRFLRNNIDWHGQVHVKKIVMNNHLLLENVDGTVLRKGLTLILDPLTASFLKGKIKGSLLIPQAAQRAYQVNAQFSGIPLKECALGTSFQNKINAGSIQGTLHLSGVAGNPKLQEGSGALEIEATEIQSAGMMGVVSSFFPLEEFQLLKLQEAKANYKIKSDRIIISSLRLHSQNLILTAEGQLSFGGIWDLDARLFLNTSLQQRLQSLVPVTFLTSSEPGYQQLPFKISGSTQHLQSDLLNKLMAKQGTNDLGGLLQGVLKNLPTQSIPASSVVIPLPVVH